MGIYKLTDRIIDPTRYPWGFRTADPHWNDVMLLIPMTGASGSTSFADISSNQHALTRQAPFVVAEGTGPQSVGSFGVCNITESFLSGAKQLSIAHTAKFNLSNKDFCIDFFCKWNASPSGTYFSPVFCGKRVGSSKMEYAFHYFGGKINFSVSTSGTSFVSIFQHTFSPVVDTWYYIRLNRSGNTFRLYIDTSKVDESVNTSTIYASDSETTIIGDGVNAIKCNFSMSYFRMTVGASRETGDTITVPKLPYLTS